MRFPLECYSVEQGPIAAQSGSNDFSLLNWTVMRCSQPGRGETIQVWWSLPSPSQRPLTLQAPAVRLGKFAAGPRGWQWLKCSHLKMKCSHLKMKCSHLKSTQEIDIEGCTLEHWKVGVFSVPTSEDLKSIKNLVAAICHWCHLKNLPI